MKSKNKLILLVCALICPTILSAQTNRSAEFKKKYTLSEVVVLSRHNIRSPLSGNGSTLGKMTPHSWIKWSSSTSELTLRGGILETMMGQFFRKWLVKEEMFPDNHTPDADEVHFYANSMQRTIATSQYFASGFMPVANIHVHHRYAPSKMDPIFTPQLTKVNDSFIAQATQQIAIMGGEKGVQGISEKLEDSYHLLSKVLDLKESPVYKSGKIPDFENHNLQLIFDTNKEPAMKGSLKLATSAADAFVLQYYEEPDELKAAFGHKLSITDWEKIAHIKDVFVDALFTAPIVAYNVAHPLLVYINDELNSKGRKFTFLCGHDSNIASINAALGVTDYNLPYTIEKKTPIGCKLVFEKWSDAQGRQFISINLVYQSTDQMRNIKLLDLDNPPMIYPLKLKDVEQNVDGLYEFEDIQQKFHNAISAYDKI